ncbi:MFS transporter [Amphibacillus cookii]|uniref:MFS transporter n=1 Tax=Amphibacillus cookii TaxID=767787 RepID=UPI00195776E9|nr:MFS transporter [Amphibacillus cookii]MBM7541975.1 putative MFS family arabinose efflux permease [Amphibacillus cookii]
MKSNLNARITYRFIFLFVIGLSHVGEWLYFIALNLIILERTGTPAALTGLYLIKPLAAMFASFWIGSVIDRLNKRQLMVWLDLIRAGLIILLPLQKQLTVIYILVFAINIASAMFGPTSIIYMTKLIEEKQRKSFNAFHSLVTSGAFLIGPALAGILFGLGTPLLAIYFNSVALLVSGILTLFIPDVEAVDGTLSPSNRLSFQQLKQDWRSVLIFSRQFRLIMFIYFLFNATMIGMTSAVDSLEAAFATDVLALSDQSYGFLVTLAGIGVLIGASLNTRMVNKYNQSFMMGASAVLVSIGYWVYGWSSTFVIAGFGFLIIGFFTSFANTAFLTFYQHHVPIDMMGRISSVYQMAEALFIMLMTGLIGLSTAFFSLRYIVLSGVAVMSMFALLLCYLLIVHVKRSKPLHHRSTDMV